jgi:hypothetical protein
MTCFDWALLERPHVDLKIRLHHRKHAEVADAIQLVLAADHGDGPTIIPLLGPTRCGRRKSFKSSLSAAVGRRPAQEACLPVRTYALARSRHGRASAISTRRFGRGAHAGGAGSPGCSGAAMVGDGRVIKLPGPSEVRAIMVPDRAGR